MIFFITSICTAFSVGLFILWRFWPDSKPPVFMLSVLALPVGWAITSALFFFWLTISGGKSNWYPIIETVIIFSAALSCFRFQKKSKKTYCFQMLKDKLFLLSFFGVFCVSAATFAIVIKKAALNPWGRWDAWARINLKGRFLFEGGESWTWIFESSQIAHSDYPLLLAATVARTWAWMGEMPHLAPQVISVVWGILSVMILFLLISWLRDPIIATIMCLAYLSFTPLFYWAASQYSDIPLITYMLSCCAMLIAAQKKNIDNQGFIFLAGIFAGAATWCKNEGILFLFVILVWWLYLLSKNHMKEKLRSTFFLLVGCGSIGITVLIQKVLFSGKSDIIGSHLISSLSHMINFERHIFIYDETKFYISVFWNWWAILMLSIAFLFYFIKNKNSIGNFGPLFCTLGLSVVYYFVLITTPYDLSWHVGTALDRLFLQLWPMMLFGLAVVIGGRVDGTPECNKIAAS